MAAEKKRKKVDCEARPQEETKGGKCVERVRFVSWQPEAVESVCFDASGELVAVGRSNGDVEIWDLVQFGYYTKWHFRCRVSGNEQMKITQLRWSQHGRLFACCANGTLFEVNWHQMRRSNAVSSEGGAIWAMDINDETQQLAVACEDGRIRIFSFDLQLISRCLSLETRLVSLAWETHQNLIFVGDDKGTITRVDVSSGRSDRQILLERSFHGNNSRKNNKNVVVWSLLVMKDLTVISGDSNGNLQMWDGENCILLQTFTQPEADVLTLAKSQDEQKIWAAGIDGQVMMLQKRTDDSGSWLFKYSHRSHTHDVRSLAVSNARESIVVSAGVDTQLVWYKANRFEKTRPNKVSPYPHKPVISVSSERRLLLLQKPQSLNLYQLSKDKNMLSSMDQFENGQSLPLQNEHKLVLEMNIGKPENISCSVISPDGNFIACSTAEELKLFQVKYSDDSAFPRKIKLSHGLSSPATVISFTPDSKRLVVGDRDSVVSAIDLQSLKLLKAFPPSEDNVTALCSLSISKDGQWLATGAVDNTITVYNLDALKLYTVLPHSEFMHTAMNFNPSGKLLVVADVRNLFICFDLEKKQISKWTKENVKLELLPRMLTEQVFVMKGIVFDESNPDGLILYNQKYFVQIDLSRPIPPQNDLKEIAFKNRYVKDEDEVSLRSRFPTIHFITKYYPIFFMDCIAEKDLVVVEMPWLKIFNNFPDILHRHAYGK